MKFGTQSVPATQTIVAPGFAGVYEIMAKVPVGLTAGNVPLSIQMGTAASNATTIAVQ